VDKVRVYFATAVSPEFLFDALINPLHLLRAEAIESWQENQGCTVEPNSVTLDGISALPKCAGLVLEVRLTAKGVRNGT
jgi:hypothetical protein